MKREGTKKLLKEIKKLEEHLTVEKEYILDSDREIRQLVIKSHVNKNKVSLVSYNDGSIFLVGTTDRIDVTDKDWDVSEKYLILLDTRAYWPELSISDILKSLFGNVVGLIDRLYEINSELRFRFSNFDTFNTFYNRLTLRSEDFSYNLFKGSFETVYRSDYKIDNVVFNKVRIRYNWEFNIISGIFYIVRELEASKAFKLGNNDLEIPENSKLIVGRTNFIKDDLVFRIIKSYQVVNPNRLDKVSPNEDLLWAQKELEGCKEISL